MLRKSIQAVLVERDGITGEEAVRLINQAKDDLQARLAEGEQPYDICEEWFGLEPDYIFELI